MKYLKKYESYQNVSDEPVIVKYVTDKFNLLENQDSDTIKIQRYLGVKDKNDTENRIANKKANNIVYYTIANATLPDKFFAEIDKDNIFYTHDKHANHIEVTCTNEDEYKKVINSLELMDVHNGDCWTKTDVKGEYGDEPGDIMGIIKKYL